MPNATLIGTQIIEFVENIYYTYPLADAASTYTTENDAAVALGGTQPGYPAWFNNGTGVLEGLSGVVAGAYNMTNLQVGVFTGSDANAGWFNTQYMWGLRSSGGNTSEHWFYSIGRSILLAGVQGLISGVISTRNDQVSFAPNDMSISISYDFTGERFNYVQALLQSTVPGSEGVYSVEWPANTNFPPVAYKAFEVPAGDARYFSGGPYTNSPQTIVKPASVTPSYYTLWQGEDSGGDPTAKKMIVWTKGDLNGAFGDAVEALHFSDPDDDDTLQAATTLFKVQATKFGWVVYAEPSGMDPRLWQVNPDWTQYRRLEVVTKKPDVAAPLNGVGIDNYGYFVCQGTVGTNNNVLRAGNYIPNDGMAQASPPGGWLDRFRDVPNPDMNRLRAWPFTFDGHTVYVLRLGQDGTVVYDTKTEQWVDWGSAGQVGWRISFGGNWVGQQIVGGDNLDGLLWNIDPDERLDDGVPISSYVTGLVTHRGLDAVPCDGVVLTGQLGDFPLAGGVTLELITSDDSGNSFVGHGLVTVQPNDMAQPEWLSLGQIVAPGRVFQINEVGGMARIEGFGMW